MTADEHMPFGRGTSSRRARIRRRPARRKTDRMHKAMSDRQRALPNLDSAELLGVGDAFRPLSVLTLGPTEGLLLELLQLLELLFRPLPPATSPSFFPWGLGLPTSITSHLSAGT
jgi:hypothetical protein